MGPYLKIPPAGESTFRRTRRTLARLLGLWAAAYARRIRVPFLTGPRHACEKGAGTDFGCMPVT